MPKTIIDKDGNEHEVLSEKEIDSMIQERTKEAVSEREEELQEKHEKTIQEKEEALKEAQNELESSREALENSDEGTKNWAEARKQIKKQNQTIEELKKAREQEKEDFRKDLRQVRTSVFQDRIDSIRSSLAGDDEDLQKKIDHHAERLGIGDIENEKEAGEVYKDAYMLATGKQAPNPLNVARGANVGGTPTAQEPKSQEVVELGKKMGLSDEDLEKYGDKKSNE